MLSDKKNSVMDKATRLLFSLFNIASAGHMPFGIPQYLQCILHGLTNSLKLSFHLPNLEHIDSKHWECQIFGDDKILGNLRYGF